MPAATAPPSRWLLWLTILLVMSGAALRIRLAAITPFRSDEAYYWTWTQEWVLSYADHPPMVAWFGRVGELIFGNTLLGMRIMQIVALALVELLLADIACRRTGSWNAALFVVLALEASAYYSVGVVVVEPNLPMMVFLSAALWGLGRLDETMDGRWWLFIGAAGGLGLLSKFTIALALAAFVVFVLLGPRHRKWLFSPWLWAGAAVAVAIFSPVIWWNVQHNWLSFTFQAFRLGQGSSPVGFSFLARAITIDMLGVGLVFFLLAAIGSGALAVRALRHQNAFDAAVATLFLFPALVYATRALTMQVNPSWTYPMWPFGLLAFVLSIDWLASSWKRTLMITATAVTGAPLVWLVFYHGIWGADVWLNGGDPIGSDLGGDVMAERAYALAQQEHLGWIATTDYRLYALLKWQVGDRIPVVQVNERARYTDFKPVDPGRFTGPALYMYVASPARLMANEQLSNEALIPYVWRGQTMTTVRAQRLDNFTPKLDPGPDSPWYVTRAYAPRQ